MSFWFYGFLFSKLYDLACGPHKNSQRTPDASPGVNAGRGGEMSPSATGVSPWVSTAVLIGLVIAVIKL